ncbi:RNA-directed DNA polymerase, eukaryota [Tanacetum coccineum]
MVVVSVVIMVVVLAATAAVGGGAGFRRVAESGSLEVGWIRRIQELDTAYWGFLGVGTTLDIFQNIILIPYLEYGVLRIWAYWSASFCVLAKELFRDNVGVGSWFSVLRQASHDFTPEGRIAWVDVEGIPFKFWSGKTFKKIATKWGELLDVDDHDEMKATGWIPEFSEDEEDDDHSEQEFISSEQSDLGLHIDGEDNGASEVPETIFENSDGMKERQSEDPFGLYSILNKNKVKSDVIREVNVEREDNRNSDGAKTNSTGSRKFKMSEIPRTGGSILSVMEEIMKVGITMGYNMDGDSIGNSGGILCIWDPNSFRKDSVTVSDYFVIVRGVWIKSGMDILIVVAVEVVMMGDFNEVRYKSDRFGSNFNAHDSWKDATGDDSNALRNLCGKLKFPLGYMIMERGLISERVKQEFILALSKQRSKGGVGLRTGQLSRGPDWDIVNEVLSASLSERTNP